MSERPIFNAKLQRTICAWLAALIMLAVLVLAKVHGLI